MVRKVLTLAIVLFIGNAAYQIAPIGMHYFRFKDAVKELALFGQKLSDAEIVDQVMVLAGADKIPLERQYVSVTRTTTEVIITASYLDTMTFIPGRPFERQFDVEARAYLVKEPPGR